MTCLSSPPAPRISARRLAQILSANRPGRTRIMEDCDDGMVRSQFEIDGDKIAFTDGFRALADKTQVHDRITHGSHHRNRLTHSMEVSRVGRSLGTSVGTRLIAHCALHADTSDTRPQTLDPREIGHVVAAAGLAHDLGNPPFGHGGEEVISAFFSHAPDGTALTRLVSPAIAAELRHHEGNAQGFRMMTRAMGWRADGGINLTSATLGAFSKYPYPYRPGAKKYGVHAADMDTLRAVAQDTGMADDPVSGGFRRHPLAWLLEAADDICYLTVDLEDAAFLGLVPLEDFVALYAPIVGADVVDQSRAMSPGARIQYLRSRMIKALIGAVTAASPDRAAEIEAGRLLRSAQGSSLLDRTPHAQALADLRDYSRDRIYLADTTRAARAASHAALEAVMTHLAGELHQRLLAGDARPACPTRTPALAALPLMVIDDTVPADPDVAVRWLLDRVTLMPDAQVIALARKLGGAP